MRPGGGKREHGHEPELEFGESWVAPDKLFLVATCYVRSVISLHRDEPGGTVAVNLTGRWNKSSKAEVHALMLRPELATELGRYLIEAAVAAHNDERVYREGKR